MHEVMMFGGLFLEHGFSCNVDTKMYGACYIERCMEPEIHG